MILSPSDQIVESIKVGPKADGNPRKSAPNNDTVSHVITPFPRWLDNADAGRICPRRAAHKRAAVCLNSASSSRESTPSASITALTMGSASISSRRGSRYCELMRCSFTMGAAVTPRRSGSVPYRRALPALPRRLPLGRARSAAPGTTARRALARPEASGPSRREGRP
jgi:hypothetical protein